MKRFKSDLVISKQYEFEGAIAAFDMFAVRWNPPDAFVCSLRTYAEAVGPNGVAGSVAHYHVYVSQFDLEALVDANSSNLDLSSISSGSGTSTTTLSPEFRVEDGALIMSMPEGVAYGDDIDQVVTQFRWELYNPMRHPVKILG